MPARPMTKAESAEVSGSEYDPPHLAGWWRRSRGFWWGLLLGVGITSGYVHFVVEPVVEKNTADLKKIKHLTTELETLKRAPTVDGCLDLLAQDDVLRGYVERESRRSQPGFTEEMRPSTSP